MAKKLTNSDLNKLLDNVRKNIISLFADKFKEYDSYPTIKFGYPGDNHLGYCKYPGFGEYRPEITINYDLQDAPKETVENVIAHEFIHSLSCCQRCGHKGNFKKIADQVNRYGKYNIHTYCDVADGKEFNKKRIERLGSRTYYVLTCDHCGQEFIREKKSAFVNNYQKYWHNCTDGTKGHFTLEVKNGKEMPEQIVEDCEVGYMSKGVVKSLKNRVKKSKDSNTITIDTQMTNHDAQLKESKDRAEFNEPRDNIYVHTELNNHQPGYVPVLGFGFYLYQVDHVCETYHKDLSEGNNYYFKLISDDIAVTNNIDSPIEGFSDALWEELATKSGKSIQTLQNMGSEQLLSFLAMKLEKEVAEIMINNNIDGILMKDASDMYGGEDARELIIYNLDALEPVEPINEAVTIKDTKEYLKEIKLEQIKQKSKNQDPARVKKARNVKTKYIGMSDFGIFNFKTTSESRPGGYHYQTVQLKDLEPFRKILLSGNEIMPTDIKEQLDKQDVNVWCTDESWAYWAWAHQAYKLDFAYIDDRIPDLKNKIQAPTVNNVRLNGGACKHILSVIDYLKKPFVLYAISEDIKKYFENEPTKLAKQDVGTQNQYDQVANWDWSDIEEYTGLTKDQILYDLIKTKQIIPQTNNADIIEDIFAETLPAEEIGLRRVLVDRTEELIANDNESAN